MSRFQWFVIKKLPSVREWLKPASSEQNKKLIFLERRRVYFDYHILIDNKNTFDLFQTKSFRKIFESKKIEYFCEINMHSGQYMLNDPEWDESMKCFVSQIGDRIIYTGLDIRSRTSRKFSF